MSARKAVVQVCHDELPTTWIKLKLGDIYELSYGKSLTKAVRNKNGEYPVYGSNGIVGRHDAFVVEGPAIIVGRKGAAGAVSFSANPCWPIDTTYYVRDIKGVDIRFSFYLFTSLRLDQLDRSTAIPGLNRDDAYAIEVQIPPLPEQRRIVAKIEELFSELDKGVESLMTARAQLKVYRQAVLKNAFEGKLTAQWHEENKDKLEAPGQMLARIKRERNARYERQLNEWNIAVNGWKDTGKSRRRPAKPKQPAEITRISDTFNDMLPENWCWIRAGDVCDVVRGGSPRPAGDSRYYDGTIPFLKVADLTQTPGIYLDTHSYTIKEAGLNKTRLVQPPILMLSNSGATLGVPKICRIRTTFNDGIAAFLGLGENDLLYHYYYWASKTLQLRAINQGAAQPNLNTSLIEETFVPLCSREEMRIVEREIGRLLSMCDQMDDDIGIQLRKCVTLRQSILQKAFNGQLVPQDLNDELASDLLDRIKRESVRVNKSGKGRKMTQKTKRRAA